MCVSLVLRIDHLATPNCQNYALMEMIIYLYVALGLTCYHSLLVPLSPRTPMIGSNNLPTWSPGVNWKVWCYTVMQNLNRNRPWTELCGTPQPSFVINTHRFPTVESFFSWFPKLKSKHGEDGKKCEIISSKGSHNTNNSYKFINYQNMAVRALSVFLWNHIPVLMTLVASE